MLAGIDWDYDRLEDGTHSKYPNIINLKNAYGNMNNFCN
jgi:hypothetical protein